MANDFKQLAAELKPRERIEKAGTAKDASAVDLLAIILKTGAAGCNVVELANRLVEAFGGVRQIVRADYAELKSRIEAYNVAHQEKRILGLGRVKLLEITAAFELARRAYMKRVVGGKAIKTTKKAFNVFRAELQEVDEQESFWVLPLDAKCRMLSEPQLISVGTVNGVNVHPRDVFRVAVRWNAHSIIVAHNHPSETLEPSKHDLELTKALVSLGKMMGIPVRDHIIIANKRYYSFNEHEQLEAE